MSDTELTVSHALWIKLDLRGLDFNRLAAAIQAEAARAAGVLLGEAMRAIERQARAREPDRWVNRGQSVRKLALPWGQTAVRRTRVKDLRTGQTYNLADRLLGLRPYVRAGAETIRTACELAAVLPYRQARHWWSRLTGLKMSLMAFWRMVQRAGAALAAHQEGSVGEIRPGDPAPVAVRRVYLEADGAWLRRQKARRSRSPTRVPALPSGPRGLLLYLGVSYSKLHENGSGRRNVLDKQITVESRDLRAFGRLWHWQVSRRFDLGRTANQLYLCDGEDGLLRLPRRYFRNALVQLDRFHVHRRLGEAFGLGTPGYRAALTALCRKELGQVYSLLALRGATGRQEVCQEVRTYLQRHRPFLWTHRQWRERTTVNKMGSGVMEKTVETQINRRMKRQGMSWSPQGARRLAKLRVLSADPVSWAAFWSRTGPGLPPRIDRPIRSG